METNEPRKLFRRCERWEGRSLHLSRAGKGGDSEMVAMYSVLQLSRIGVMDLGRLAAPTKVCFIVSCMHFLLWVAVA